MKRFQIWILFILLQIVAVGSVWLVSTPQQQASYLAWLGIDTEDKIERERQSLNLKGLTNNVSSRALEIDQVYQCTPKTRSINTVDKNRVYRWVDENGITQFSDKPSMGNEAENLTNNYSNRFQFFTAKVINRGTTLPADIITRLSVDTRQIFSVLSHMLSLDQLRQVDVNMHVFDNQQQFNRFKESIAPGLSNNIAGFYNTRYNLMAIKQQSNDENTFATARHEAAHVIISGLFGNIPSWFTEGIAEYFELMSISSQLKTIAPNAVWLDLLKNQHRSRTLMPLDEYFQYDLQTWRAMDQNTMYATAWSLVYFLMSSQKGQKILTQYMNELLIDRCRSINSTEFFNSSYKGGLAKLDRDWSYWLVNGQHASHRF